MTSFLHTCVKSTVNRPTTLCLAFAHRAKTPIETRSDSRSYRNLQRTRQKKDRMTAWNQTLAGPSGKKSKIFDKESRQRKDPSLKNGKGLMYPKASGIVDTQRYPLKLAYAMLRGLKVVLKSSCLTNQALCNLHSLLGFAKSTSNLLRKLGTNL